MTGAMITLMLVGFAASIPVAVAIGLHGEAVMRQAESFGALLNTLMAHARGDALGLPHGLAACVMDEGQCVHLVDTELTLRGAVGDTLSLLPATPEASGVSLEGLEYPLADATLTFGTSWGMSNVFTETTATVTLRSGRLFVFHLFRP